KGRNEATGFGVATIVNQIANKNGVKVKDAKVAIQGFGNVGSFTVKNVQKLGTKIVAIGEWTPKHGTYAIYNENGLDFDDLYEHFYGQKNGNFLDYPKGEVISLDDFWKLETDILIPAALENAITEEVAEKINTKI